MSQSSSITPTVLSIAGFDPYGGAGIIADTKVIHALGGYALSVTTALTAQNSKGVKELLATPATHLHAQLEAILDDMSVDAVKIGMLANTEIINVVAEVIKKYHLKNIVLDTVLVSSSGKRLLQSDAIETMTKKLFPLADLITPNIPEVNTLLETSYEGDKNEIESMAKGLFGLGANSVLIKGGHSTDMENATDYIVDQSLNIITFNTARLHTTHTHGTGCVLSSAIAIHLAKQESIITSVSKAKDFLYKKLDTASTIKFNYNRLNEIRKEPLL